MKLILCININKFLEVLLAFCREILERSYSLLSFYTQVTLYALYSRRDVWRGAGRRWFRFIFLSDRVGERCVSAARQTTTIRARSLETAGGIFDFFFFFIVWRSSVNRVAIAIVMVLRTHNRKLLTGNSALSCKRSTFTNRRHRSFKEVI